MAGEQNKYVVKSGAFEFTFTKDEIEAMDIIKTAPGEFHLIKDHHSISAKLPITGETGKRMQVEVEGDAFAVEIKDELDQLLEKMGYGAVSSKHIKEIKAPMPGLVLEIAVSEGQDVLEGDKILILGAMKMENSILVHADGTIKKIKVTPGQAVDKGQVMVELV